MCLSRLVFTVSFKEVVFIHVWVQFNVFTMSRTVTFWPFHYFSFHLTSRNTKLWMCKTIMSLSSLTIYLSRFMVKFKESSFTKKQAILCINMSQCYWNVLRQFLKYNLSPVYCLKHYVFHSIITCTKWKKYKENRNK